MLNSNLTVIIPCHNEGTTIAAVIKSIKKSISYADILVIDNASTDNTSEVARKFKVDVVSEHQKGKGFRLCHYD